MISLKSLLRTYALAGSRVLLRTDFNVPLRNGVVLNDYRLLSSMPTVSYLLEQGAQVIIATHIGRPTAYDDRLSTKWLIPWFKMQGLTPTFVEDPGQAGTLAHSERLILLDNLRFFAGEKGAQQSFAGLLAKQADYFVQDAFGSLHRADASISLLPLLFAPDRRTIGFLVEKELTMLNSIIDAPKKPFVLILGGGKVTDKLPLIRHLIAHVNTIIIGPAVANTFLYAQGYSMGLSLIDHAAMPLVKEIIVLAQQHNVHLMLPEDLMVAQGFMKGPLRNVTIAEVAPDDIAIGIGPATQMLAASCIKNAGTIFYNGLMGSLDRPQSLGASQALFNAMAQSSAFTVIAGGDSVAAAQMMGVGNAISYLSTGGGATLTYLSGAPMPGLTPFIVQ